MTLHKAIEILQLAISDPDLVGAIDLMDAQKLAIDALIFLAECHTDGCLMKTFSPTGENPIPDLSPSADRKQTLRESNLGRESG
ncbi:unnamed protein product [marine sediment metagenome]|uniref:Uncharacterized protein n=1 Tax=marine sediment metagenome TaxID=412755 RepID=X1Q700_9ZZZZ